MTALFLIATIAQIATFTPATIAQAATYPVNLGENVNLRSGDMAVVQYGNQASVISCGGGSSVAGQEDFTESQLVNLSDDFQNRPEDNARLLCEMSADYIVTQTGEKLVKFATNECLRSYRNCRQLGKTTFEFVPRRKNRGQYGCYVQAIVRGTN